MFTDKTVRYYYFDIGDSLGDPHIKTIDGLRYDFNGLGEYWLIKSDVISLQGRTEVIEVNGESTQATYFSGFAVKHLSPISDTIQLLLSENKREIGMINSSTVFFIKNIRSFNTNSGLLSRC